MKIEKAKSVPVDPNVPENPVELLVKAVTYLQKEVAALAALAHDGANCESAHTQTVLMSELDTRLGNYRDRGLQALGHITNDVVDQYNSLVAQRSDLSKRLKEAEAAKAPEAATGANAGEGTPSGCT